MKVAIPVFKNSVSPRIDVSDCLLVYDVHGGRVEHKETCNRVFQYPAELVAYLQENNINQVICGGCPQFFLRALLFYGFDVAAGVSGDPEGIMKQFVEGKLQNLSAGRSQTLFCKRRCRRKNRSKKD